MEKELKPKLRGGRFTSSKIWQLTASDRSGKKFGARALTYIQEKRIERKLNDSITTSPYSRAIAWGNFMEFFVYAKLFSEDIGYKISSKTTELHPSLEFTDFWSGSCDLEHFTNGELDRIAEIKCYEKKNFSLYSDALISGDIKMLKKNFPQEYWQLVSNAIIHEVDHAEAICFMPYLSEHKLVADYASDYEGEDKWKYRFIYEEKPSRLNFLRDDNKFYKDVNRLIFEVPQEDIDFLTERVRMAIPLLEI